MTAPQAPWHGALSSGDLVGARHRPAPRPAQTSRMPSTIRPLTMDDAAAVHALLLRSPEYTRTVRGREVAEGDAQEILTVRPPQSDPRA